jgi:hypothetical protein
MSLLDGVRAGQPLAALLGYRLERALQDAGAAAYIAPLRLLAPLHQPLTPRTDGMDAAAHATDVVDGIALINRRRTPMGIPWNNTIGDSTLGPETAAVNDALDHIEETLDAVADALLAEHTHQTLLGNAHRAGAALSSSARGDLPPPDLEFLRTPRTGVAVTHRVVTLAPPAVAVVSPREKVEPRLAAWARTVIGDLGDIAAIATYLDPDGGTPRALEPVPVRLADYGLTALDLIALADTPDELQRYLTDQLLTDEFRPAGTEPADRVQLDPPDSSAPGVGVTISELLEVARGCADLIHDARALIPGDIGLDITDDSPGIDIDELEARAASAVADLTSIHNALVADLGHIDGAPPPSDLVATIAALHTDLVSAWRFGIVGAVPATTVSSDTAASTLGDQARSVDEEIRRRLDAEAAIAAPADPSDTDRRDVALGRLAAVIGRAIPILPVINCPDPTLLGRSVTSTTTSTDDSGQRPEAWFARLARVRSALSRLATVADYSRALAADPPAELTVGQLPVPEPADGPQRWAGLPANGTPIPPGQTSLVYAGSAPGPVTAEVAGLLVDEWTETVPNDIETTAIAFQADSPGATAPQAILLAVPPVDAPANWSLEALEATLLHTLDLMRARVADIADVDHEIPIASTVPAVNLPTDGPLQVAPHRLFRPPVGYAEPQLAEPPSINNLSLDTFRQATTTTVTVTGLHLAHATYAITGDGVTVTPPTDESPTGASFAVIVGPDASPDINRQLVTTTPGGTTATPVHVTPRPQITAVGPNIAQRSGQEGVDPTPVTVDGIGLAAPRNVHISGFAVTVDPTSSDRALILTVDVPRHPPWTSDWDPSRRGSPLKPPRAPTPQHTTTQLSVVVTTSDGTVLDSAASGHSLAYTSISYRGE